MRARKVYRIYAVLPDEERVAFGRYLASPYFNMSQRLVDFRQLLEDALVQQPEQELSAEQVWQLLPGVKTEFRANGFDKLCAELLGALNDFIGQQEFRKQPTTQAAHLLEGYVARNLDAFIPGTFIHLVTDLGDLLERDATGIYAHQSLLRSYGVYLFRQPRAPRGEHLLRIDEQLNAFFLSRKLELAAAADTYNKVFKGAIAPAHLDLVQSMIGDGIDEFPVLLRLQALAWIMIQQQADSYFFRLKAELVAHWQEVQREEAGVFFYHAINHCALRANEGKEAFEAELDGLYQQLLANGLLLDDGRLPPTHFKNIVSIGLRQGHLARVAAFIDAWGDHLTQDHDGNALIYNRAVLAFYQGDFTACLRGMELVLRDVKEDLFYGLNARLYVLRSLFERNAPDDGLQLESRMEAFRIFMLRDKKFTQKDKDQIAMELRLLRKLLTLRHELPQHRPAKIKKFMQELDALRALPNRKWYREIAQGMVQA